MTIQNKFTFAKLAVLLNLCLFFFACNQNEIERLNREKQALNEERESLIEESNFKDSTIDSYMENLIEIEKNLSIIKEKQSTITLKSESEEILTKGVKERIGEDMVIINELMEKNKELIGSLNQRLKNSNLKINLLNKRIEELNGQLTLKDEELTILNSKISSMSVQLESLMATIDTLTSSKKRQSETIAQQTKQLNLAYYVMGSFKELSENNVINKEGGFLGLGKEEKLISNFNKNYFTTLDITQTRVIPIAMKKAELITSHPTDSYILEKNKELISSLRITDPENFWKASKFLVIQVK